MNLLQTVRAITDPTCGSPGCIIGWAKSLSPELHDAESPEISAQDITKEEVLRAIDSLIFDPTRTMPAWPSRVRGLLR